LIQQLQDQFPILWMVKKLNVARSGYYSWLQRQSNPGKRAQQDEEIAADIELVFKTHRRRYGPLESTRNCVKMAGISAVNGSRGS
jgi:hypothetical protein